MDLIKSKQTTNWKEYKNNDLGFSFKYPSFLTQSKDNLFVDDEEVITLSFQVINDISKYKIEDKIGASTISFDVNQKKWVSNGGPTPKKINENKNAYLYQNGDGVGLADLIIIFDSSYARAVEIVISADSSASSYNDKKIDPELMLFGFKYLSSKNENGSNLNIPTFVPKEVSDELNNKEKEIIADLVCTKDIDWSNSLIASTKLEDGNELVILKVNCYSDYYLVFKKDNNRFNYAGAINGGYNPFAFQLKKAISNDEIVFSNKLIDDKKPTKFLSIDFHSTGTGIQSSGEQWYGVNNSGKLVEVFSITKKETSAENDALTEKQKSYQYFSQGIILTTEIAVKKDIATLKDISSQTEKTLYIWNDAAKKFIPKITF